MLGLGGKWFVVSVTDAKIIVSNHRSFVPCAVEGGSFTYDKKNHRLPKSILDKVQSIIDARSGFTNGLRRLR
jgi:hypothetical protein